MIDNYFKFEKNLNSKAKTRYELVGYSEPVYDHLNLKFIYFMNTPERIKANQKRKSDFGISQKEWISSVFIPDIEKSNLAYGDVKNTEDLILIIISENVLEFFLCKGKRNLFQTVLNLLYDGELDEEMTKIKSDAVKKDTSILEMVKS